MNKQMTTIKNSKEKISIKKDKVIKIAKYFSCPLYPRLSDKIYKKNYINFLNDNKKLLKIKCIIISTRYTHRILKDPLMIRRLKPSVVLTDNDWAPNLDPYIKDKEIYNLTTKIIKDGVCVFKDTNALNIFKYINKLKKQSYCEGCFISSIKSVKWYGINDELILLVNLDTESG